MYLFPQLISHRFFDLLILFDLDFIFRILTTRFFI